MNESIFPVSETRHLIFCIIACVFFLLQFLRTKRWHQLILAVAIPLSMLVYIDPESKALFYGVGIAELVLLTAALVIGIVQGKKIEQQEKAAKEAAEAADAAAETAEQAADAVAENVEQAADAAAETAEQTADAAAETVEQAADAVTETAEQAADAVAENVEQAADAAAETGTEA